MDIQKLQTKYKDRNKITNASASFLEKHLTHFKVKLIKSLYPMDKVTPELLPFIEDMLESAFIVGSAWPTNEGWEFCYAEDTIFIAIGFNYELKAFKISKDFILTPLDIPLDDRLLQTHYVKQITYSSEECLSILDSKTPDTKLN